MRSSKEEKMNTVEAFYGQLFDPDPVDDSAMTSILTHIPDSCKLTDTQKETLTEPITIEDVLLYSKRSPKKSSPGPDGLPYETLNLIVTFEPFHSLIGRVYNDVLDHGIFPATWDESLMSLLPKKGDLTQMKNYRPISLVNTDTKIFTRLVNSRIMRVSRKIVNENQLGFILGRYIAENGMITQVIMEHAACQSSSDDKSLALLLDQEKAYDRINLHYLEQVMLTWGFPASIMNSIITMLANNRIKVNVNGFISADVFKRRGLKQGDPISPILYNLALEPFLRSVLQDSTYSGYIMALQPHLVTGGSTDTSVNVKILCYADDTLVFIKSLQDLSRLKHHIEVYSQSFNARINYNKVETISLSGRGHSSYWGRDLTDMNIPRIHLPTNPDPIVYLGFPLIQSSLQRRTFMSQFTNKIKQIALMHSTRSLLILGRATIVNSLLLSMCWYLFRVTPITKSDISKIRSVVSKFMNQGIFPRIKWSILTLPKHLDGLNLIDPHIQQAALYFRWIQPLLVTRQRSRPSKVTRLLRIHLKNTYNTQHHVIPLLFQEGRRSTQLRLFNICNLLTKSIDLIPRNFSTMELNPHACLLLPIQDIFIHPEQRFKFPSICGQMKVQDLFQYNPQTHTIARIPHADMDNRFKRAANKIFRGVEASKLFLSYFFGKHCIPDASHPQQIDISIDEDPPQLSFTPFVDCLQFTLPSTKSFTDVTTKIFRKTCNQLNTAPKYLTDILPQRWLAFWSLYLTATQRNVIYRLINKKIPHKDILHKFFLDKFDTPNCSFCASTVDSLQHFLFDCPIKQVVWQGLVREFLWPTVDTQDIFKAFTTLDYYSVSYCQSSDITAESVHIVALGQVWKCHWQSIFNQQPFLSSTVLQAIRNNVQQHIAEEGDLD